jgi:transposase-like protein
MIETDTADDTDVDDLADALAGHGIPERRARIVALLAETEMTYEEIADEMGVASTGSIWNQVSEYRETRENALWLAEHAPEV